LEALKGSVAPAAAPQAAPQGAKDQGKAKAKAPKAQPVVLAEEPARPPRFKVKRKVTCRWDGRFITLQADDVISDSGYGPGAIDDLRNQGVDLEPVA
jgi:hypothetical protein